MQISFGKMLEFGRIDISEGIDTNETGSSHECIICHYCYFLRISFRFQPNKCKDRRQKSISFNVARIVTIGGND